MAKKKARKTKTKTKNNNKLRVSIVIILIIAGLKYFADNNFTLLKKKPVIYSGEINNIALPEIIDSTYFIRNNRGRFSYYYSPKDKQAKWVSYALTKNDITGRKTKRTNDFRVDSQIKKQKWNTATSSDYYKSSFDRGHLLPSADRNKSTIENSETFLYSNIAPQKSSLNRNSWRYLEEQIRKWAEKHDTLYIVTGGVLEDKKMGYIGKNKVTVPHRFYKVILGVKNNQYNAIGFIMPNSSIIKHNFMTYAMSVNQVEKITKIDFFDNLPEKIERKVERYFDRNLWVQTIELESTIK